MPDSRYRIVATAGHIDHGKSTLIEALSGTDPDRLPEERRRQMTIDLGFAHLDLPDREGGRFRVGLVDVPGHADFVRNMVAGVGSIDAAILVVAADDGWMPQTEEHLQILLHLGVRKAIVALTKSDLTGDPASLAAEIASHLSGTDFAAAPIVPVCALGGEGLDAFTAALAELLAATPEPPDLGRPRLFVDRAFSPRGTGTIVTGTLTGGCFRTGDAVAALPSGERVRIRGLQNHGKVVEQVRPGMRVAMNLPGIAIADLPSAPAGIARGSIIVRADEATQPSRCLHVWLSRPADRTMSSEFRESPLRHGRRVWLHHGTAVVAARLVFPEGGAPPPGQSSAAELRLAEPVPAIAGDRFILRDASKRHTLAGGLVVFAENVRPGSLRGTREIESLRRCAAAPGDPAVWLRAALGREGLLPLSRPLPANRFSPDAIASAVDSLSLVSVPGTFLVDAVTWRRASDAAREAVESWHRDHPGDPGLPVSKLRGDLLPVLSSPRLFEPLVETLVESGFVRGRGILRAQGFVPKLPPAVRTARLRLLAALNATPENPPPLSSLLKSPEDKAALDSMLRSGMFLLLTPEIALATTAYEALKEKIRAHLLRNERATVAELRDALGSARRIMVPLCERLDRERFTVRQGDWRRLAQPSSGAGA